MPTASRPVVVVFLQNPWSRTWAGRTWPRRSWLKALRESRSGKRLAVIERAASGVEFVWDNTTRAVGDHPDSRLPPDHAHVRATLALHEPVIVVACGRQAAETLPLVWDGPLLVVPHPTYRLLTDRLYKRAGRLLAEGISGTVELVQRPGRFRVKRSAGRV